MLRWISLVVLSAFCLVAFPLVTYAQVTNLVLNPSFEDDEVILDDPDWQAWATWGWENGLESTVAIDEAEFIDGTRSLRVEPKGDENWYFIVLNLPMPVELGGEYTASFWAKAQEARPLTAQMKATDNTVSFAETGFELTTEWSEYSFPFTSESAEVKLEVFCAGNDVPFWLDFVYVYEGVYVEGIMPSEAATPVEPAGKLAARWGEIKSVDF